MIVVDDNNPQDPQSPGERSPLKSPTSTVQQAFPQSGQSPPPPPPYGASSYDRSQSYHSGPNPGPGNLPPPVTVVVLRPRSALGRFLRALGVALIILFLWGMFVESLQMIIDPYRRGGRYYKEEELPQGIEWMVRNWYKPVSTPPTISSCSCSSLPSLETGRVLPIVYPPTITPTEVLYSVAVPTSTSSPS